MRQTSDLITAIRTISRNSANSDGTFAITDAEIVQYLNDAQDRLQNLLCCTKNIAKIFVTEKIIPLVAAQEAYSVSDRVLLNKQFEYVEYSATGLVGDYIRLKKYDYFNRDTNSTTYPQGYFKRGGQIMLQPTPSTAQGALRISYERELDDLSLRCGTVTTATLTQLDIADVVVAALPNPNDVICVVDVYGNRLATNIPVTMYAGGTTSTADITPYLATGKVIGDLVGGYVTTGRFSTAISNLPDNCERYLIHYPAAELFHRDSSQDFAKESEIVSQIETDIVKTMASQTSEVQFIPQMNQYEYW